MTVTTTIVRSPPECSASGWIAAGRSKIYTHPSQEPCIFFDQIWKTIYDVPLLQRHFGVCSAPSTWEGWTDLPLTDRSLYETVSHVNDAVRSSREMFAPAAPMNFGTQAFPVPLLQSYEDKEANEGRIALILDSVDSDVDGLHLIIASTQQRYAAADLADYLIGLGYQSAVLLTPFETRSDPLMACAPRVLWLMDDTGVSPSTLRQPNTTVLSINMHALCNQSFVNADVLHLDPIGYLAVCKLPEIYTVLPSHFLCEIRDTGELVVTTLRNDLFPLVRYRTGMYAIHCEGGFRVLRGPDDAANASAER